MAKHKCVFIEWLDSKGITGTWEYLDEIESLKPVKCRSIGFLLEETKEHITIAQGLSDTQVVGRMTIPKCSILKIQDLR